MLPNLTKLSMSANFNLMNGLKTRFPNLQTVEINEVKNLNDKVLSNFLVEAANLKSLQLRFIHSVWGSFLEHLPASVDSLAVEMCYRFQLHHLLKRFQKRDLKLSCLDLILGPGTEDQRNLLTDILKIVAPTLQKLRLKDESGNSFKVIATMKNLKELSLESFCDISASDLQRVVEHCTNIEVLKLSELKCYITSESKCLFRAISAMPNLEHLVYFSCCNKAYTMFRHLANGVPKLKTFSCISEEIGEYFSCNHDCTIETAEVIRLLKTHPNLEELEMCGWMTTMSSLPGYKELLIWEKIIENAGRALAARDKRLPPLKIIYDDSDLEDDLNLGVKRYNQLGTRFKMCRRLARNSYF